MNKHYLPAGIILALTLLVIATAVYPGGSQSNAGSVGFDWKDNYICNLFGSTAVNSAPNTARYWAISGMFILCATLAFFFAGFAHKISQKSSARVIRFCGITGMIAIFPVVTPLHDIAITVSFIFSMTAVVYIAIIVLASKLFYQKVLACLTILSAYTAAYLYYTRTALWLLPTMQKISLVSVLIWFLALHYFTTKQDFIRPAKS